MNYESSRCCKPPQVGPATVVDVLLLLVMIVERARKRKGRQKKRKKMMKKKMKKKRTTLLLLEEDGAPDLRVYVLISLPRRTRIRSLVVRQCDLHVENVAVQQTEKKSQLNPVWTLVMVMALEMLLDLLNPILKQNPSGVNDVIDASVGIDLFDVIDLIDVSGGSNESSATTADDEVDEEEEGKSAPVCTAGYSCCSFCCSLRRRSSWRYCRGLMSSGPFCLSVCLRCLLVSSMSL